VLTFAYLLPAAVFVFVMLGLWGSDPDRDEP
jgi:hypothetical protein